MVDEAIYMMEIILSLEKLVLTARSGQIVVALVNGEATLKCYVNSPGGIELHPRNKNFSIIKINSSDNFNINGVLLYSFRNYLN